MNPASNTIHPPVFLKDDRSALLRWLRSASRRVIVRVLLGVLGFWIPQTSPAAPYVVELNDPLIGVNAAGISQPRADFLVTDPLHGDAPILWTDPLTEVTGPAVFSAFVDTGASGFAISALHVSADPEVREAVPQLDLTAADIVGSFTEIGVGGAETGDVTRPFGIRMIDGQAGSGAEQPLAAFNPYGSFNLWVRREIGTGEANEFLGLDPINLVGMPVIRQRRMWMTAPVFNVETFDPVQRLSDQRRRHGVRRHRSGPAGVAALLTARFLHLRLLAANALQRGGSGRRGHRRTCGRPRCRRG